MTDVDLSSKEMLKWIFSGLDIKIWQCNFDPIDIVVQTESLPNHTQQMAENPEIIIHNSSFSSLDLKPGTKVQITDCYIDAQFKPRPTLIKANNSDVSIQNCHFGNFINENDSTVLYGHDNSHVIIDNSDFVQHNGSKGVLFLQNNSSIYINNSAYSDTAATSVGYSALSLQNGSHTDVHNTMFRNNSALAGGAMIARFQCKVTLTNCTFSSNKAITGTTMSISKKSNLRKAAHNLDQNNIRRCTQVSPNLFNHTSLHVKKPEAIATRLFKRNSILKKNSVQQEGMLETEPGQGGVIYVAIQSQLFVTNCTFEDNSAQFAAGAISADSNVTLRVQKTTFVSNKAQNAGAILSGLNATLYIEETTFAGNKAPYDGGTINIEKQAHIRITNCVFVNNTSQGNGGAITAMLTTTLYIQETNFTRNRALQGGAIDVDQQSYLRMTNCVFDENISQLLGGAIDVGLNAILDIQETNFTRNSAPEGGAIDVQELSYLRTTDCIFRYNRAEVMGGAIVGGSQVVMEISGSYFWNNSASQGGVINVQDRVSLSLTNCTFELNFGDNGGAIMTWISVKLQIQETNFTGNSASLNGGALDVRTLTDCHIVQCVFNFNTAKGPGGAVSMDSKSSLQLENTNFTKNNATEGGVIYIDTNSKLQIKRCSFWKNFGKQAGGAIALKGFSTTVIESCHFLSNHAVTGGALYVNYPEHVSVHSTSFLRNVAVDEGGAIAISNGTNIIINNITCVGNQCLNGGSCLSIDSVILTLNNSDISKNFGDEFGAGVYTLYSRIQVGTKLAS